IANNPYFFTREVNKSSTEISESTLQFYFFGANPSPRDMIIDNVSFVEATERVQASIPEPTTLALMGLGLAGLGLTRRKRIK
ncbi:MAG: PEP-CTERM sorting domain-containing protein, partial [Proteobacteria bacterium]|nr:PEP-CTERM sorting domain-containing protein [Pseudomonadota bacterium]